MNMMFFRLPKVFQKNETFKANIDFDSEKFGVLLDDALSKCMSIGGKTFDKINHLRDDPHCVAETMCWKCGHRWIATFPVNTLLKQLQCPHCEEQGFAFMTNQDLDAVSNEE